MQIGFVGLGKMGSAMASNLAKAGHRVVAWNRSPVTPEEAPGVTIGTLADVLKSEVVLTMLSDDAAQLISRFHLAAKTPQYGINTRLMRKVGGRWVIVLNHVSAVETPDPEDPIPAHRTGG